MDWWIWFAMLAGLAVIGFGVWKTRPPKAEPPGDPAPPKDPLHFEPPHKRSHHHPDGDYVDEKPHKK